MTMDSEQDHAYDVFAENVRLRERLVFLLMVAAVHSGLSLGLVILVTYLLKELIW